MKPVNTAVNAAVTVAVNTQVNALPTPAAAGPSKARLAAVAARALTGGREEILELTVAVTGPSTAASTGEAWGQVMYLYSALNDDWTRLTTRSATRRTTRSWATTHPQLARFETPAAIVATCQRSDTTTANELIAELLDVGDPLALRTCLEIFLPLIRATSARANRRGHCETDSPWPQPGDLDGELLAETWRWLQANGGRSLRWPAPRLARQLWRYVTRQLVSHRRHQNHHTETSWDEGTFDRIGNLVATRGDRSVDEDCARAVIDAYRSGQLDQRRAQVLYGSAVLGHTIDSVARTHRFSAAAARQDKHRHGHLIAAAVA